MVAALGRRVATAALTLVLVTVVVFLLVHLAPGDPAPGTDTESVVSFSREHRAALDRLYRLDQPIHRQYLLWLGDVARGDLGRSFHDRRPVLDKIRERLPVTVTLNVAALTLMVLLAVPLGALAAMRPGSLVDRAGGVATYALYALPAFWVGLLLQMAFSIRLGWLPLYGLRSDGAETLGVLARLSDGAAHLALPVCCLTYGGLAYLSRFVRANLLESAGGESARAARARGLSTLQVLVRHGFRQAAVPMLTLAGFLLPGLVGGSVIVEKLFAIPGIGGLFFEAALQQDIPVLLGLTLVSGSAVLLGTLLADVAYVIADPRVRRG